MTRSTASTLLPRRKLLGALGATGAVILVGCGDSSSLDDDTGTSSSSTSTTGETTGTSGADQPTTDEASTSSTTTSSDSSTGSGDTGDCAAADAWATGGTAAMTAKACYPDPFAGGVQTCPMVCETTAGPCTTATTIDRQDVSEGFAGLPVRLALLVVDATTCQPIADARVEIWHTQRTGVYSGITPNPQMCYGNDPAAAGFMYFRGVQTSGADGRVDFDTCFPGWYNGRALHIHFRVDLGDDNYITSQLFFDDTITAEIFSSHPDYSEFGQPNTHNDDDNIIGGADDITPYLLDIARMPDGAMLASKVIAVRSSLDDANCSLGGGGMMPPPMP